MITKLVSPLVSPLVTAIDVPRIKRGGSAPFISGNSFPGEILTSTKSGDWYVDGEMKSTGTSYVVSVNDIGLPIHQVAGGQVSNVVPCWSPSDEAGVFDFWAAHRGVLHAVGPDTPAIDGQTIREWRSVKNGYAFAQATAAQQPLFVDAGADGNPVVRFDGSNDVLQATESAVRGVFRNKLEGGCIVGAVDSNPAGLAATHYLINISTTAQNAVRAAIMSRYFNTAQISVGSRTLDSDGITNLLSPSAAGYRCFHGLHRWQAGQLHFRLDGMVMESTPITAGATSDTHSNTVTMGSNHATSALPGDIGTLILYNAALTANAQARLERFTMLYGGVLNPPAYTPAP
ncbi:MAG: hypothetical protein QM627_00040 [Luteolibacter sp.]